MYETGALELIPIASIRPSPYQYRTNFDDERQRQLMESLQANGLSTPVLVRPVPITAQCGGHSPFELLRVVLGKAAPWPPKRVGWGKKTTLLRKEDGRGGGARCWEEKKSATPPNPPKKGCCQKPPHETA